MASGARMSDAAPCATRNACCRFGTTLVVGWCMCFDAGDRKTIKRCRSGDGETSGTRSLHRTGIAPEKRRGKEEDQEEEV
eukprot:4027720-Pyramimonas_sp.AAC.1